MAIRNFTEFVILSFNRDGVPSGNLLDDRNGGSGQITIRHVHRQVQKYTMNIP